MINAGCFADFEVVDVTVPDGDAEALTWRGAAGSIPLFGVTALNNNGIDDISWDFDCGDFGEDYRCAFDVDGPLLGSSVRIRGLLLNLN